ncbi:DUF397 domain-containing protein [Streptomyces globisporus]|uniref:DUF397 domain-containing protein n=1 Tax=Streptomyces globisporus TaxID=1908 RepID=UPI0004C52361|nr:DUF397 domain-containing protein [Streptomyces globisporus]
MSRRSVRRNTPWRPAPSSHQSVFPYGPWSTPRRAATASSSAGPRPDGPVLVIPAAVWAPFVEAVKAG